VDTQQQASELTGCNVYFPRELAETDDEMPSLSELVGFCIVDAETKNVIGTIESIDNQTVNILFELEDGTLIPASDDLIADIDMKKREITMHIPEGLLALS
jgi:16S rRNA processing protein RimM